VTRAATRAPLGIVLAVPRAIGHDALMSGTGRLVAVLLLVAMLTACGSTGRGSSEKRITIGAIAQQTLDAKSARLHASSRSADPRVAGGISGSGTARFDPERYSLVMRVPRIGMLEALVFTHDAFMRAPKSAPAFGGVLPHDWCKEQGGVAENGFGFSPTSVISSLAEQGGTLQRLGNDRLRGVETTHYRLVKAGVMPTEVWVDSNDRLRRIQQTHDGEIDVLDYFDYGAAVPPITAPPHARHCEP
jgi:hypothetical protein